MSALDHSSFWTFVFTTKKHHHYTCLKFRALQIFSFFCFYKYLYVLCMCSMKGLQLSFHCATLCCKMTIDQIGITSSSDNRQDCAPFWGKESRFHINRKIPKSCCVAGCKINKQNKPELLFPILPVKERDPKRRALWLQTIRRHDKEGKLWQYDNKYKLVSVI